MFKIRNKTADANNSLFGKCKRKPIANVASEVVFHTKIRFASIRERQEPLNINHKSIATIKWTLVHEIESKLLLCSILFK